MILSFLIALAIPQLPVAEQNRRMDAYTRLPVVPCETAITPRDAIWTAAQAEGRAVTGCFEMRVQAVGNDRDGVYLNSERDYRDPRNVTVRLSHPAAHDLRDAVGGATLGDALVGRRWSSEVRWCDSASCSPAAADRAVDIITRRTFA